MGQGDWVPPHLSAPPSSDTGRNQQVLQFEKRSHWLAERRHTRTAFRTPPPQKKPKQIRQRDTRKRLANSRMRSGYATYDHMKRKEPRKSVVEASYYQNDYNKGKQETFFVKAESRSPTLLYFFCKPQEEKRKKG